jgi:murein DD-endopeptidase MepM/ murein hydrolase activator NlpD
MAMRQKVKRWLSVLVFLALPGTGLCQSPSRHEFIFPLEGLTPYTAEIISILDHSGTGFGISQANNLDVTAYTGESGTKKEECSSEPCGFPNAGRFFWVNSNYTGANGDEGCGRGNGGTCPLLNYRGHSGYDYRCARGDPIRAAADGQIKIHPVDNILGDSGPDGFNTFRIDHGDGWESWYLHAGKITNLDGSDVKDGSKVTKGEVVAKCGKSGTPGVHLHFEIRHHGKIVDPYGWEWPEADPISKITDKASPNAEPLWDSKLWHKPKIASISASPVSSRRRIVQGDGFREDYVVTLWDRRGRFLLARPQSRMINANSIEFDLPSSAPTDNIVVKVGETSGPRSTGVLLPPDPSPVNPCLEKNARPGMSGIDAAKTLGPTTEEIRFRAIQSMARQGDLRRPLSADELSLILNGTTGTYRAHGVAELASLSKSSLTAIEAETALGSPEKLNEQSRFNAIQALARAGKYGDIGADGALMLAGTTKINRARSITEMARFFTEGMISQDAATILGDRKVLHEEARFQAIQSMARAGKLGANGGDAYLILDGTTKNNRARAIADIAKSLRKNLSSKEVADILGDPIEVLNEEHRFSAIQSLARAEKLAAYTSDAALVLIGTIDSFRARSIAEMAAYLKSGLSGADVGAILGSPKVLSEQYRFNAIQAIARARKLKSGLSGEEMELILDGTGTYRAQAIAEMF